MRSKRGTHVLQRPHPARIDAPVKRNWTMFPANVFGAPFSSLVMRIIERYSGP
jgi:hypothetical protein